MLSGQLTQWNDARGFGFIAGDDGQRYFVHISHIGRIATRPRQGDLVSFSATLGKEGRWQAKQVKIAGANPRATEAVRRRGNPPRPKRLDWRFGAVAALVGLLALGIAIGTLPWQILVPYVFIGIVTFGLYQSDKSSAEANQWRVSEARLLAMDLVFGIIGGLLAQAVFRHKTRKIDYVATTLVITAAHALWLGALTFGFVSIWELLALLRL